MYRCLTALFCCSVFMTLQWYSRLRSPSVGHCPMRRPEFPDPSRIACVEAEEIVLPAADHHTQSSTHVRILGASASVGLEDRDGVPY